LAAALEGLAQGAEEGIHELLRLPLVQPYLLVELLGHLGFGQRHAVPPRQHQLLIRAPCSSCSAAMMAATARSTSPSVRVRDLSSRIKPVARLLKPGSTPL